jgi:Mycothiol maleylpyruvate isomerase N-terminal domain
MNPGDVVFYGHRTVLAALEGIPAADALKPGVCGKWSVKDIIAHLTSFELVLGEVLACARKAQPTPTLDGYRDRSRDFNDVQVALRAPVPYAGVVAEYTSAHDGVMSLLSACPAELLGRTNSIPWYGPEYSIEDFIVYANYGHKREHCAQIKLFKNSLKTPR